MTGESLVGKLIWWKSSVDLPPYLMLVTGYNNIAASWQEIEYVFVYQPSGVQYEQSKYTASVMTFKNLLNTGSMKFANIDDDVNKNKSC